MDYPFKRCTVTAIAFLAMQMGCTQKRNPELPSSEAPQVFSIQEFKTIDNPKASLKVKKPLFKSLSVNQDDMQMDEFEVSQVQAPENIKFMFDDLTVFGSAHSSADQFDIAFNIDKKYVTAYKVVDSYEKLAREEKMIAKIQNDFEKSGLSKNREALKVGAKKLFIPIFKYPIEAFGVLEKTKNSIGEETHVLSLKPTDFKNATHIKISFQREASLFVDVDQDLREDLSKLHKVSVLEAKIMNVSEFKTQLNIDLSKTVAERAKLTGLFDSEGMHIYKVYLASDLNPQQIQGIKSNQVTSRISGCPLSLLEKNNLNANNCYLEEVLSYKFDYVKLEKSFTSDLNEGSSLKIKPDAFEPLNKANQLVLIDSKVEPKIFDNDFIEGRTNALKIDLIKNKEFFFRRTMQAAPLTTSFLTGEASPVLVVKFELGLDRLTVVKVDSLTQKAKYQNELEQEELMSLPVKYYKVETFDSKGQPLAMKKYIKTTPNQAQVLVVDWSENQLSQVHSPLEHYGKGACIKQIADQQTSRLDNRLEEGILNFTMGYSVSLVPDLSCLGLYDAGQTYNPYAVSVQFNARLQERVSFKLYDKSTESQFGANLPFNIQKSLNYGVWTIGQIKPSENGISSREGQQKHLNVKHDFRNGKKLIYTVVGLPQNDPEKRDVYEKVIKEVIDSWNFAYTQVYNQNRRFVEYVIDDSGLTQLGDLDKNIIYFDNKPNDNHGVLGVSQVGFNPRSAIVVADSLIIYAGNLSKFVEFSLNNSKNIVNWKKQKEAFAKTGVSDSASDLSSRSGAEGATVNKQIQSSLVTSGIAKPSIELNDKVDMSQLISKTREFLNRMNGSIKPNLNHQIQNIDLAVKASPRSSFVKNSDIWINKKQALQKNTNVFKFPVADLSLDYVEKAFRKYLASKSNSVSDLEAFLAEEMLLSKNLSLNLESKSKLSKIVNQSKIHSALTKKFNTELGCAYHFESDLGAEFFAGLSFKEALAHALRFDLAHEMGHSQGLTHNFMGSFDKANFSKNSSYSSVMDYIEPANFKWDGIGQYDIRALKASHIGKLKASSEAKKYLDHYKLSSAFEDEEINLVTLQTNINSAWSQYPEQLFNLIVTPVKFCTDVDVSYVPTCQRFDHGTTATEIASNLMQEFEDNYINSYFAWDRIEFNYSNMASALSQSMKTLIDLRQFMDEYFYLNNIERDNQEIIDDYSGAALKGLVFFNNLVRFPTVDTSFFDLENRISILEHKNNIEIVESKALNNVFVSKDKIDTIGILPIKVMALNLLALNGLPFERYLTSNTSFNYVDFESMTFNSSAAKTITSGSFLGVLSQNLVGSMVTSKGEYIFLNEKVHITPQLRLYGALHGVLTMQSEALKDQYNHATLFKVASSMGQAVPTDRPSVTQRVSKSMSSEKQFAFWPVDGADLSAQIIRKAERFEHTLKLTDATQLGAELNYFFELQRKASLARLIELLSKQGGDESTLQVFEKITTDLNSSYRSEIDKARGALKSKIQSLMGSNKALALFKSLDGNVDELVENIETLSTQIFDVTYQTQFALNFMAQEQAQNLVNMAIDLSNQSYAAIDVNPLLSVIPVAMLKVMGQANLDFDLIEKLELKTKSPKVAVTITNFNNETHGILKRLFPYDPVEIDNASQLKIIEFLGNLTLMVNPEYNR